MKEYINKKVNMHVKVNGADLYYTAKVLDVNDNLITIKDREGKIYSYRICDIIRIGELRKDTKKEGVNDE